MCVGPTKYYLFHHSPSSPASHPASLPPLRIGRAAPPGHHQTLSLRAASIRGGGSRRAWRALLLLARRGRHEGGGREVSGFSRRAGRRDGGGSRSRCRGLGCEWERRGTAAAATAHMEASVEVSCCLDPMRVGVRSGVLAPHGKSSPVPLESVNLSREKCKLKMDVGAHAGFSSPIQGECVDS
ncbi:hypothetical protein PVAP13_5KG021240 [Panicum virgatum]|uniref:Uncharacterized protein n=1 Tax=Panicum virgatum TaxID=38727 RepID=A0A8T0SCI6_PANVG|nr:hypothetical protein PVAP13_5KG021240 [Panicum virgatum]